MKTKKHEKCVDYQTNSILKVLHNMNKLCCSIRSKNPKIGKKILVIEKDLFNAQYELREVTNDSFMLTKNAVNEKQETVTLSVTKMQKYVSKLIEII